MTLFSRNSEAWLHHAKAFSDSRCGVALRGLIAFADSSVLPVLADLLLKPLLLLRSDRTLSLTSTCVIASSVEALVSYTIGHSHGPCWNSYWSNYTDRRTIFSATRARQILGL